MTAPFYSNPGLVQLAAFPIWPRKGRIDPHQASWGEPAAILVGHAHYDHLMDLPRIVELLEGKPQIFGNRSAANLLAAVPLKVSPVDETAGTWRRQGSWHRIGHDVRVMALESEHANHVGPVKLYGGHRATPVRRLPWTAYGWVEGYTYAYVIDFLQPEGGVAFRIHVQDAASQPPLGFVPQSVLDEHLVDLAIITAAGFQQAKHYPEALLRDLRPRHTLIGHWEDFFRSPWRAPKVVRLTSMEQLLVRIDPILGDPSEVTGPRETKVDFGRRRIWNSADPRWTLPAPGARVTFQGPDEPADCEGR